MKRVYLVGVISEDPKSHEWRREAKNLLKDKFEVDDPTSSKFDRETLKESEGDAEKMHRIVAEHQAEILLPKSLQAVEKADIILINLDLQAKDRPMIGSIMELAWAFLLHKTVIAIKGESYYSKHPMILGSVHAWAKDVQEACDIIKEFFTTRR
jgi:nucleoside 2-deoxyribosyltransferase